MEINDILNDVAEVSADINPLEKVFIPDWNNKPTEYPPVLLLNGVGVLTWQNLSAIIAAQGMGKSSLCEAILASFLNPDCDALGWEVDPLITGIIYIDFERTNTDVWNSFSRMAKRAGIKYGTDISKVVLVGMRSIPRLEERKAAIVAFLDANPLCKLLVMDGAGDLITDSNDLPQAIECRIWIRELTIRYGISIFTTLHPNPGTLKPRGHIGSEIMREAEAVMAIQKKDDLRIIFSDFDHGKNRNGANIWGAYAWDDNEHMHCQRDVPQYLMSGNGQPKRKVQALPDQFGENFHIGTLRDVFAAINEFNAEAFYTRLIEVWDDEENDNMSRSRAVKFKNHYLFNDYLIMKAGKANNEKLLELAPKYLYPEI
jgi:hypothetical protein